MTDLTTIADAILAAIARWDREVGGVCPWPSDLYASHKCPTRLRQAGTILEVEEAAVFLERLGLIVRAEVRK